ncbi:uncharacterized protein [Henckelia pumila]|uniref:uncharacterized protein n=1 Tax=Henckelia pumila TaxID=405737 RepID=UPI003C6DFC05
MVEMEKSPKEIGKKYWKMLKIMVYMVRKGLCKSKLVVDFHMLLSQQGKLASKAINKLILHNHNTYLSCRSENDVRMSFISPREYEFSCSNTPVCKNHRRGGGGEIVVVQKVFEILNDDDDYDYDTPVAASPCMPADKNHQVDKDAEAFINKFYKDLKNQKRIAATLESPSPYHKWSR